MSNEVDLKIFAKWGHVPSLCIGSKRLGEILEWPLCEEQKRCIDSLMCEVMLRHYPCEVEELKKEDVKKLLEILHIDKSKLRSEYARSLL